MNKTLLAKVKEKTKDTGLSEKYVNAITEKMGGSIADDSTDEDEIEKTATLIADVAAESQGEATRWVTKNSKKSNPNKDTKDGEEENGGSGTDPKPKGKGGSANEDSADARFAALEKELNDLKAERTHKARMEEINASFEKHGIPKFLRDIKAKSISDEDDLETVVSAFKQECITNGLISGKSGGAKAASEKQVDDAADALLESLTAK